MMYIVPTNDVEMIFYSVFILVLDFTAYGNFQNKVDVIYLSTTSAFHFIIN